MRTSVIAFVAVFIVAVVAAGLGRSEAAPAFQQCTQVVITSPASEDELRGVVTIEGSATTGDFQFYKVEYSTADQPDFWRAVSQTYSQPIVGGILDRWNTPALPDGGYNLKLTVVDNRGQEVCRSVVRDLTIANTRPTATLTPAAPPTLPGPTITATPRASATPAPPTPSPTVAAIIPTREPAFPDLSTIRQTVRGAFDVPRLQDLFLLGAGTTAAVFVFVGVVGLLRRFI